MNYNSIAEKYKNYGEHAATEWEFGYKHEIKLLEPLHGKKILDYGCGDGKFTRYLASFGADVVGVDVSTAMIQQAIKNDDLAIEYRVIHTDETLPFESETFDAVVINFVLCVFSSRETIRRALTNLHRVLKPDGKVILLNGNWDDANGKKFVSFDLIHSDTLLSGDPVKVRLKGNPDVEVQDYYWSVDDYRSCLNESGFAIEEVIKPMATITDVQWMDEKVVPPCIIISAAKKDFSSLLEHVPHSFAVDGSTITVQENVFSVDPAFTRSSSMLIKQMGDLRGKRVLDLGSGTGILSISAARRGAVAIIAADISEQAIKNTEENVALNDLKDRVSVRLSDVFSSVPESFDIILANLPILTEGLWTVNPMEIIERFLSEVRAHLNTHGYALLAWGSFSPIEPLIQLLERNNLEYSLTQEEAIGYTWTVVKIQSVEGWGDA